jgi:uncharacterized membrane protein (UPF0127 family)
MSVLNRTRGKLLAETLLNFNSHFRETLNLLNKHGIPKNSALWINPCHAMYTTGISKPVDIAFLDKNCRVVKILRDFPPNCFTESIPGASSALGLPSNSLAESDTRTGDLLELDLI